MKLGRREPALGGQSIDLVVQVAVELDQTLALYRELLDKLDAGASLEAQRERILRHARDGAAVGRLQVVSFDALHDGVPDWLAPDMALGLLRVLRYGLVALAQDPPDLDALVSRAELEARVAGADIEDWLVWCLERASEQGWR